MDHVVVDKDFCISKKTKKYFSSNCKRLNPCLSLPLCVFILTDSYPECWKPVEVPADCFHTSHKAQVHESFIKDIACDSCSEEDVEKLVIRLVESFHCQIEIFIDSFDVCKCLRSRDVHLNHWTRRSRNVLRS